MKLLFSTVIVWAAGAAAAFGQTPVIAAGGVLNGASFGVGQPVTPGSLASIFGSNLAATNATGDSIPLSTTLAGVTVSFNGISAPLLGVFHDPVNGDQINAQVPWEVQNGAGQVVVTRPGAPSTQQTVQMAVSPGVFAVQYGVGQAIAYGNSDGALASATPIPGLTTHPAKIGDPATLVILATGLGPVHPPVATAGNALDGQLHPCVTTPAVLVGGVAAQVVFAGMSPQFVGVYQLNIVIQPGTPTGNTVPLQIQAGGFTSTDKVTIAVSN